MLMYSLNCVCFSTCDWHTFIYFFQVVKQFPVKDRLIMLDIVSIFVVATVVYTVLMSYTHTPRNRLTAKIINFVEDKHFELS